MANLNATDRMRCPRCAGTDLATRGQSSQENNGLVYSPMQCDRCGHRFKLFIGMGNRIKLNEKLYHDIIVDRFNKEKINKVFEEKIYTPFAKPSTASEIQIKNDQSVLSHKVLTDIRKKFVCAFDYGDEDPITWKPIMKQSNLLRYRVTVILPKEVLEWHVKRIMYIETDGLPLTLSVNVLKPGHRESNQYPPGPADDPRLHWDEHMKGTDMTYATYCASRVYGTVYEVTQGPKHP